MGVSIFYSGNLDDRTQLSTMCDRLIQIANDVGWQYRLVEQPVSGMAEGLYWVEDETNELPFQTIRQHVDDLITGIRLQPPDTETFQLTVNQAGRLAVYFEFSSGEYRHLDTLWVKTNRALQSHLYICDILRYLQQTYFSNLEVQDETEYYETGDLSLLTRRHMGLAGYKITGDEATTLTRLDL